MNDTLLESNGNDSLLEQHSLREILLAIECFQSRIINLKSYLREAYNKTDHTQKSRKKKDLHGYIKLRMYIDHLVKMEMKLQLRCYLA